MFRLETPPQPPLTNTVIRSAMRSALKGSPRALGTLEFAITRKNLTSSDARRAHRYVLLMQTRSHVHGSRVKSWMHAAEKGKRKREAMLLLTSGPWRDIEEQEDAKLALKYLALLGQYLKDLKEWEKAS